jgi:predicted nuclease of predicted toxin-antitoxin system
MKILIDESLPIELKNEFKDLEVFTVNDMKWLGKKNGELLTLAVDKDFDIFITVDKNLKYQLNIKKYKISIIVLDIVRTKQEFIKPLIKNIRDLFSKIKPYEIHVVNAISNE